MRERRNAISQKFDVVAVVNVGIELQGSGVRGELVGYAEGGWWVVQCKFREGPESADLAGWVEGQNAFDHFSGCVNDSGTFNAKDRLASVLRIKQYSPDVGHGEVVVLP